MKKSGWLVFACLLGGSALGLLQEVKVDLEAKNWEYVEGTKSYKVLGVCHETELAAECWNPKGEPDESVKELLRSKRANSSQINMYLGKRNLTVLVNNEFEGYDQIRSYPEQGYINSGSGMLQLALDPAAQKFSFLLTRVDATAPPPPDILLDPTKPATISGETWTYVKAVPLPKTKTPVRDPYGMPPANLQWNLVFSKSGQRLNDPYVQLYAYDKDGKAINYVNKSGAPLSDIDVVSMGGVDTYNPNATQKERKVFQATLQGVYIENGTAIGFKTNIEPSRIKGLRRIIQKRIGILFRDLPAYPSK